ncbi:hypothetical protein ACVWYH_008436 [Bradyrhizobium sp. GM24.11]
MDSAFSNALKRLDDLKTIIEASKREMDEIEVFLTLHKRFSKTNPELNSVDKSDNSIVGVPRHDAAKLPVSEFDAEAYAGGKASLRAHRRGNPAAIANAVKSILHQENRAMTRGELAEELERRGTPLPGGGKDARAKYVGTILWRNGEIFENHEGKGYWFAGKPLPGSRDVDIFENLEATPK